MRIDNTLKNNGYFWLPKNPERKIPGILIIENGGRITIETLGNFDEKISDFQGGTEIERLIGYLENGELVTLEKCIYTKKSLNFGGISKSELIASHAFIGVEYEHGEPLEFNSLSFQVDCLDEWVGISGIKSNTDYESRTTTITYTPPEKIIISLSDEISLEIYFSSTAPGFPLLKEAKVTQSVFFNLKHSGNVGINELTSLAHKINNFICFALDENVSLKNLTAKNPTITREIIPGKFRPVSIKVFYQSISFSEKEPNVKLHDMLFRYADIKDNFEGIIKNWLKAYNEIDPCLNLYFATKNGAYRYLEGRFISLAQGLENYHRRTSTETSMPEKEFKETIEAAISSCPEEKRDWLKGKLTYANEIPLGKRISAIISEFPDVFGDNRKRKSLARKVVDTRNYLTHYNEDLKEKAAFGRDLWLLCLQMELMFQLHFLKVVGFKESDIKSVINNSQPIQRTLAELK